MLDIQGEQEHVPCVSVCRQRACVCLFAGVFKLMSRWGFSYVENLTWVLLAPNHSILQLPCANVQRSHITLYIFRKDGKLDSGYGRRVLGRHGHSMCHCGEACVFVRSAGCNVQHELGADAA